MDISKPIFISHASEDRELANELCCYMEANGLHCWLAPRDIPAGANFGEAITEGIERSGLLILILSRAANRSDLVLNEIAIALDHKLRILPFRIDDTPIVRRLQPFLKTIRILDAAGGTPSDHFETLHKACIGIPGLYFLMTAGQR
jgi:hypothetical protein